MFVSSNLARRPPTFVDGRGFARLHAAVACAPLTEIIPAAPGDGGATLGFALAWAQSGAQDGLICWAAPEQGLAEDGAPHAEGLAQFALEIDRLLLVRARTQSDALWACEQALTLPKATVVCTTAPSAKPLSLTTTRRLLLAAEKHATRCVLLRLDTAGASAAWTRWRIAAAPSRGHARELGPPAFIAFLERNRAGPAGQSWRIEWNAHDRTFHAAEAALDGAVADASANRQVEARRRRAI